MAIVSIDGGGVRTSAEARVPPRTTLSYTVERASRGVAMLMRWSHSSRVNIWWRMYARGVQLSCSTYTPRACSSAASAAVPP